MKPSSENGLQNRKARPSNLPQPTRSLEVPEVRDYFSHLDELSETQLKDRREELVEGMPDDYENVADEVLTELFAITRKLVSKSKTPVRKKAPAKPKTTADLADLFKT